MRGRGTRTFRYAGGTLVAVLLGIATWLSTSGNPPKGSLGEERLPALADLARHTNGQVLRYSPPADQPPTGLACPEHLSTRPADQPSRREFGDPFYAFLVGIAEGDSLGTWTSLDLQTFLDRYGGASSLPLEYFHSLERRATFPRESESRRGVQVARIWCLTLEEPLHYPMPYRILGHSLGSVSMARRLQFSEWRLGDRKVHAPTGKQITVIPVTGLTVFRLDSGWIMMDVNGLLDKILGRKLDDCWTQGFAICRQDGQIRGLALSRNRDQRPLCGEIDFATNQLTSLGRPFARGVAVYVRPWVDQVPNNPALTLKDPP